MRVSFVPLYQKKLLFYTLFLQLCLLVHMAGKVSKTTKRIEIYEVTGICQGQCKAIGTSQQDPIEIPTLEVQEQVDNAIKSTQTAYPNIQDGLLQS